MFYCMTFWVGFLCSVSGMSYVENPNNSVLIGMVIIYSGIAGVIWSAVKMVQKYD